MSQEQALRRIATIIKDTTDELKDSSLDMQSLTSVHRILADARQSLLKMLLNTQHDIQVANTLARKLCVHKTAIREIDTSVHEITLRKARIESLIQSCRDTMNELKSRSTNPDDAALISHSSRRADCLFDPDTLLKRIKALDGNDGVDLLTPVLGNQPTSGHMTFKQKIAVTLPKNMKNHSSEDEAVILELIRELRNSDQDREFT